MMITERTLYVHAASALVLNMANSVEQFTDDGFDGNVEEETGHFTFRFHRGHQYRIKTSYGLSYSWS